MKARHRITIESRCPVNNDLDRYVCDVYPTRLLFCEKLELVVFKATRGPITQEELTQKLADDLDCMVRTRGQHCQGRVESVVVCRPRPRNEQLNDYEEP